MIGDAGASGGTGTSPADYTRGGELGQSTANA
jgi:hypothetical protein